MDLPPEPTSVEELEVAPRVRVKRSRLAFAVSITLAALPILVLDNLSATAETSGAAQVDAGTALDDTSSDPASTASSANPTPTTTAAPTTSTSAPAPATTEAPTTTEAAPRLEVAEVDTLTAAPPTTAPPTTAPPTTTAPSNGPDPADPATWDRLAQCESGGNWSLNSGNGYYGGLQFSMQTWQEVGGTGYPHQATKAEQVKRGKLLQQRYGWSQWPYCARQLGY